ncbi:MAG: amino acid adenylation domain-containing protein, partial [Gemmatimonadetes bacterium]|nr:amino acid adenylation domain-containing protein [Gemmatimonadota bacterium]
ESFFELGGHSLLAAQVVARVWQAFEVEVPLTEFFETPTVAELAAHIDALRGDAVVVAPSLVAVERDGPLPLSFAQQRLWFIEQLEPGSGTYNVPLALRVRGGLRLEVLERTLTEVVRRHEALRTVFTTVDGEPAQIVRAPAPVRIPVVDLRSLGEQAREAEALRLARAEAVRPFDLTVGPLLRTAALRLGEAEWAMLLTTHHIVSDGWSAGVLVREVSEIYGALGRGEEPRLPELPVQYADYAVWQRKWLQGEVLEEQLAWWRERLAGAPPLLELPTDRPRPQVQDPGGATLDFVLSPELSQALEALSRREGATLFMTLLAGWQALLGRWAGQDDVVVGTPIANRSHVETEGLIGYFVNTLALRTELSGDPSVRALLGRVREATLGAYAHQELPFERLVEELAPERSLAHSPLFQVLLVLHNLQATELRLGSVEMEPLGTRAETAKFDLTLAVDAGERIAGSVQYRTSLWERASIERLVEHLRRVLGAMTANPEQRLSEIELLSRAERAEVLEAWNATRADYPQACVHELVSAQAARTPDATAVVFEGESLSYAELEARANRLAHHLVGMGVGPETRVGVCAERSAELVVALLAVLRAGGAYVPLDPSYPAERLGHILADSEVPVLLTQERLLERIPAHRAAVVCLDRDACRIAAGSVRSPTPGADPRNLAYVIYTSGSTGTPKGVGVPHAALSNHTQWMQREFPLSAGDRVLQKTPFGFDASVWEFWAPLVAGATLVVAAPGVHREPARLARLLAEAEITTVQFVPTLLGALLEEDLSACRTVRRVFCGGEALPAELAARCRAVLGAEVVNLYGPTEACIDALLAVVEGVGIGATAPIGRPVANTRAYVLDGVGQPAPIGVAGELYVGGAQLARGYVGRSDLTADRFVPDPFGPEAGGRLYRTGDRARRLADGTVEYLGRTDHQVKIRGFRVEPGEIEAVLCGHEQVREAVVSLREDVPGRQRLAAYVTAEDRVDGAELRAYLAERLPEYMVPGAFVVLEELPVTANGKVDRGALPAPETASGEAYVAPRTPVEELMAGIWAEVLKTGRVGAEDDFFALGGHSLLATQVVSRARQAFGVEVPLRALFEAPTLAALAGRVEALRSAGAGTAPSIERPLGPREGPLPLSFAQQRLWVVDRLEPGSAAYHLPSALRLRGPLDTAALRASLDALVARHESLRTTFAERGGVPVQVIHPPAPVPLPVLDLRELPEAEREATRLAAAEAQRPFDLARGPLLRSTLLRLADDDHVLCFTMHHVVSDGWSMGVLVREVSALYNALSRGEPSPLPELPVQYADFALWQRAWLSGETLERQLSYWRDRLAGAPALLELPTERPRPAVSDHRGAVRSLRIDPAAADRLRALGRREGATLFMTLLAGFAVLLSRYSGQADVVVGTPIAGRNRRETEGLIGFFLNTLALRTDLSGDPTFRELLARVREATLGAYAHQDLPFERILEELQPVRSLSHAPVFQVMLNLQNFDEGATAELQGVRGEDFGDPEALAKYDLTLYAREAGGEIRLDLVYAAELFEGARMEEALDHLATLLGAVAADPELHVSRIPLLGEAERAQRSVTARGIGTDRPFEEFARGEIEQTIPARFAAQVRFHPDRLAVRTRTTRLTYAELDRAVEGVARAILRARPAGPERVALLFEHDAAMIVGILGVLRAGKTYVPIDPLYPRERSAYVLEDSGAAALVTNRTNLELARELAGGRIPLVDVEDAAAEFDLPAAAAQALSPEEPAYILYTSGSTGQPKGVVQSHRNVLHFIRVYTNNLRIGSDDRLTLFSSYTFDAAVMAIYGALLNGAALFPFDWREEAAAGVAGWMRREGITLYHSTPTVFRHLV